MLPTRAWQDWANPPAVADLQAAIQDLEQRVRRLERRQRSDRLIVTGSCAINVAMIVMLFLMWW
jgi:hypothetical protein